MSDQAVWSETADPEMIKREERIASLRAELILLGRDPKTEMLTLGMDSARMLSTLVHHALGHVDLNDDDLKAIKAFERLLMDKHWLMARSSRPHRAAQGLEPTVTPQLRIDGSEKP